MIIIIKIIQMARSIQQISGTYYAEPSVDIIILYYVKVHVVVVVR